MGRRLDQLHFLVRAYYCLRISDVGVRGAQHFPVLGVGSVSGETKFVSLIFLASILVVDCQFGHPIVLKIFSLMLNNKNPELLDQFSHIGFFRGLLSKNNDVRFFFVCHYSLNFQFIFHNTYFGENCSCELFVVCHSK